ncbi:Uncharacterised protein [BD1-7 clade bacterium]|uniref:Alpha-agarase n=1 Tax=BD1-7 clade bacterium TaxID=2029982 RepID=A0A5S9P5P3_9GAMM|nr:Uncharacterised protein [BD1-7 clade bacterium]
MKKVLIPLASGLMLAACLPETPVPTKPDPYWYRDADADMFGNSNDSLQQKTQPDGYVANKGDCDDDNAQINPGITEIANNVDQDCDGTIDNGFNYIFSTSTIHSTDFGALENADIICQQHADSTESIVPAGTYKAWISNSTESAADRLVPSANPYVRSDKVIIANNWIDLTDGTLIDAIAFNELGTGAADLHVMTGTDYDGTYLATNCNDWTSTDAALQFTAGLDNQGDKKWTNWGAAPNHNCGNAYLLYCIRQSDDGIWYLDSDDDGYGATDQSINAASKPDGYVTLNGDCNDTDALISPAAVEITTNDIDDNCDGNIDNKWYIDNDSDGFGDPSIELNDTDWSFPLVNNNDDCDDTNPLINPDATDDSVNDIDENCDGIDGQ